MPIRCSVLISTLFGSQLCSKANASFAWCSLPKPMRGNEMIGAASQSASRSVGVSTTPPCNCAPLVSSTTLVASSSVSLSVLVTKSLSSTRPGISSLSSPAAASKARELSTGGKSAASAAARNGSPCKYAFCKSCLSISCKASNLSWSGRRYKDEKASAVNGTSQSSALPRFCVAVTVPAAPSSSSAFGAS